ncbi:MAG: sulfite exporter TauE/SafE family protein [Bacteroidetes bacterium]|nr:sulfite exporter TauE/SafE family protein [Bacteroidota bacterium]
MEFLLAAISLGFLGSFHCVGMCGPIALALPVHQKTQSEKILAILTYNFGRIITYTLFGVLFGILGQSVALFGYQQWLSVSVGVIILIALIFPKVFSSSKFSSKTFGLLNKLKSKLAAQFSKHGIRSFFSIGLLNGLLPCGMVYIAIAGAVATGDVYKSALFMAVFGAGTLPMMFAITYSQNLISVKVRNVLRKSVPIMVGIMAVLLILRGANLGINYISPKLSEEKSVECHSPQINCCQTKK